MRAGRRCVAWFATRLFRHGDMLLLLLLTVTEAFGGFPLFAATTMPLFLSLFLHGCCWRCVVGWGVGACRESEALKFTRESE